MVQFKALPKFLREFKKLYPREQEIFRIELAKIRANPAIGELKKGALSRVRVHKFKMVHQLYLLAYELDPKRKFIYLYALGTHENFYAALQRYLKGSQAH